MDERRELFRKILHFLKWPTGSVTFWPHSFEHDKALIAQPGQFWKGVREAQASGVVVFGQQAFKTLFPRESFHYSSFDHNGRKITVLPGPVEMLAGDMDAKRLVWNTLKAYQF
ncbi:hypothetical protein [Desulfovibrio ferrophilus]|nr:hypothetical protein [Desulfovibrio ferrophilus]